MQFLKKQLVGKSEFMVAFYLDELPWHQGYCIISNNFDKIKMPKMSTSYGYLEAALVGMTYEEYLIFCKENLGGKISRKNGAKYASIHLPITEDVKHFVELLNNKFKKGYNNVVFTKS